MKVNWSEINSSLRDERLAADVNAEIYIYDDEITPQSLAIADEIIALLRQRYTQDIPISDAQRRALASVCWPRTPKDTIYWHEEIREIDVYSGACGYDWRVSILSDGTVWHTYAWQHA